ncbi:hypothetical protein P152DRAFT_89073 [Eremomyces bilateralis CBS 781.70]|uniref:Uncharacterized protein n=1 Tax=Eremomyces bilateralis CBS 781.70 TaxID=1392243 RepID=A0A6G1FXP9_9PEZI|nr:uncharacterized protein P152DRAFT_89073 [Eremomyces bilateralis CBS 781.70]KAF1810563.1 hypothetical protein P152DRAFT_89073 [Eremomyces bilateralis CBS 781.70]
MAPGRSDQFDDEPDEPVVSQASEPPTHPLPAMQGPFEESIVESIEEPREPADTKFDNANPKERWMRTLERDDWNGSYNFQWRNKSSRRYHPLWKLMAQIVFGIHLLQNQLAKSDDEVLKILQVHLNEIDMFIVRTTEDFETAAADIKERVSLLKLPLQHTGMFDRMLDDRHFRASIIRGNESIYKIVDRSARAMNDLLVDVNNGLEATSVLAKFLEQLGDDWHGNDETLLEVYTSMCGNAEGWFMAFKELEKAGNGLGVLLVQLGSLVNEMSKRVGVASRRSIFSHRSGSDGNASPWSQSSPPQSRGTRTPSYDKPLPQKPDQQDSAVQNAHPVRRDSIPLEKRFENPRKQPQPPERISSAQQPGQELAPSPQRNTKELVEFFRPNALVRGPGHAQREPPKTAPERAATRDALETGHESDTPTAKPKRKPSKLRKKSHDMLRKVSQRKAQVPPTIATATSPTIAPDSAYSSGSDYAQMQAIARASAESSAQLKNPASPPAANKLASPFQPSSVQSTNRNSTSATPIALHPANTTNNTTAQTSRAVSHAEAPAPASSNQDSNISNKPPSNSSRPSTPTPTSQPAQANQPDRSATSSPSPSQPYPTRTSSVRVPPNHPIMTPPSPHVTASAIASPQTTRPATPSTPRLALFPRPSTPRRTVSQDSTSGVATTPRHEKATVGGSALRKEVGKDSPGKMNAREESGTKQTQFDDTLFGSMTATAEPGSRAVFQEGGASANGSGDRGGTSPVIGSRKDRSGIVSKNGGNASRDAEKSATNGYETPSPKDAGHMRKRGSLSSIKRIFSRRKKEEVVGGGYGTVGRGIGLDEVAEGV